MESTLIPHNHNNEETIEHLKAHLDKTGNFQTIADIFKILADSSRLRIFWLLCHCEECVVNISSLMDMSSPAVSHHLRMLKDSGFIVSRRIGKEVYYRADSTERSQMLHRIIEDTMEISCPDDDIESLGLVPALPGLDSYHGHEATQYSAEQIETIHSVHKLLTENLDKRYTIEELSKIFLMNPSTLKEIFKAVYGNSIASHIKDHRMEHASALLINTDDSIASIAAEVGYESHSKFSAEFKKAYDTLPAAYRKQHR